MAGEKAIPLDGYILDFVCFEAKLIVELDGGQHAGSAADMLRDEHFRSAGFRTFRIWNNDLLQNTDGVFEKLKIVLDTRDR